MGARHSNRANVNFTGATVVEMYSYTQPGQVAGKQLLIKSQNSLNEVLQASLSGSWGYNNEGTMVSAVYRGAPGDPSNPQAYPGPPTYTYTTDTMGRLNGMTEQDLTGTNTYASGRFRVKMPQKGNIVRVMRLPLIPVGNFSAPRPGWVLDDTTSKDFGEWYRQAQFFILLHELPHFFNATSFIQNDGTLTGAQNGNNDLLWKDCSKTILSGSGPVMM